MKGFVIFYQKTAVRAENLEEARLRLAVLSRQLGLPMRDGIKRVHKKSKLEGRRYGKITVMEADFTAPTNRKRFLCQCDCGLYFLVSAGTLKSRTCCGCTKPCLGAGFKHGHRRTPEYEIWKSMKQRCFSHANKDFKYYGGRGIAVCSEWVNSFEEFLSHIGPRPSKHHSIDRINNNGNYEPGNVRWATPVEQANNKRPRHLIEVNGISKTPKEWGELSGISGDSITRRISHGWTNRDAIWTPSDKRNRKTKYLRRTRQ